MSLRALGLAATLALFAALPALAQSASVDDGAFANVEGGKLWYQTCGNGPKAMVLIHDGVLHSAAWDEVWPIFCKDFHVVRYDRRGFGRSPAAAQPYSQVDDLWAVMRATGLNHAVIVGSSAGGGLAVDFTLRHPEAVDRLVLAGAQVSGLENSQYFTDRTLALLRRLKKGDIDGALRDAGSVFAPGHDAARARAVALLKANPQDLGWLSHPDPARAAPDARPLLPTIKAPTLILIADHDSPDAQGWAGALEALIPRAKRVVVPDAGHLMYLEHPELFAKLVVQFIIAKPHPDREASVRRYVESLIKGTPNYNDMTPSLADNVRQQSSQIVQRIKALGALKSISFQQGTADGSDVYLVTFEHGQAEWTIGPLTADGKVQARSFRLI